MNIATNRSKNFTSNFSNLRIRPGIIFGVIILTALFAFEIFNYSTTDYALRDLLGDLRFAGVQWATILSIAFCGIDFAGIARLFTPESDTTDLKDTWYLFGAWIIAAIMNAALTWWGVSMAISNHVVQSTAVIDANTLIKVVPIFVAIMVWVIRILIIGSLSAAGNRLFSDKSVRPRPAQTSNNQQRPLTSANRPTDFTHRSPTPSNQPIAAAPRNAQSRVEPTYHSFQSK